MQTLSCRRFLLLALAAGCAVSDDDPPTSVAESALINRAGILGDGFCAYGTAAAAIAAAVNGQTVLLEEGHTFNEHLGTISKNITIRAGSTGCAGVAAAGLVATIDGTHSGRVVQVTGDVTFRQIALANGSVGVPSGAGANLWVTAGTTTLIDALVYGGESNPNAFDFNTYGGGIHVDSATLEVEGTTHIYFNTGWGLGAGGVYVGSGATAVFRDDVRIGLPVFGPNFGDKGGGGLMVRGTAELRDRAQLVGNLSDLAGGGALVYEGTLWLYDSARVANNTANGNGGGLASTGGGVIHHTAGTVEIADNTANGGNGGGIYINGDGTLDLQGTAIRSNVADECGGGIYQEPFDDEGPTVYLTRASVTDNRAGTCGGGAANVAGLFDADGATVISGNHAGTDGGGLYLSGTEATADLDHVTLDGNRAARGGGLLARDGSSIESEALDLTTNTATGDGGGGLLEGAATSWNYWGGDLEDNTAARGGGLHVAGGTITAEVLHFRRNHATTEGGAGRITAGATVAITHGGAVDGTAGTFGGGFAVPGGLLQLINLNILRNTTDGDGGGLAIANAGRVEATDVHVSSNTAVGRGGGIAVLSFAANTDPQLAMIGLRNVEGCVWRGEIGKNEYCSDIKDNTAASGGGVYLEDGTSSIARTAIRQNIADSLASALWMRDVATGSPVLAAGNVLIVNNGDDAAVDSVRVAGGAFAGEAITSADNLGAPFRFTATAPASLLQRSIVWDAANVINSAATALGATCTMFRAVTGATVGPNQAFGLDPMFVTTARGKYRLGVPSVNAVDQCATGLPVDLDSDPRPIPVNGLWDRGAFERQ